MSDCTPTREDEYMIQILESNVETITESSMGQVSSGYIKLRGWLRKFVVAPSPGKSF
jgi:hypothetical protein